MRRSLVAILVPAFILTTAALASAGGSPFPVQEVHGTGSLPDGPVGAWAGRGSTVTMRGVFCDGSQAHPSAGPWTAYLQDLDGDALLPLAPVAIGPAPGNVCTWQATSTFVVPDVPLGRYWVRICADDRCEVGGVGDLAGGSLIVASTENEAKLVHQAEHMAFRVAQLGRSVRRLEKDVEVSERTAAIAERTLRESQIESGADRREMGERLADARAETSRWRAVAVVALVALATALVGLVVKRIRRREPAPHFPDTIEGLLHPADAMAPGASARERSMDGAAGARGPDRVRSG